MATVSPLSPAHSLSAPGTAAIKQKYLLKREREDSSGGFRQVKKVRGQNKHRPRSTKQLPQHRLCRSTVKGFECAAVSFVYLLIIHIRYYLL